MLEAINNINESWRKLPPEIIQKCFVKCGFQLPEKDVIVIENDIEVPEINVDISHNKMQLFASIVNVSHIKNALELLRLYDNIPTSSLIDDEEFTGMETDMKEDGKGENSEKEDDDPGLIPPSNKEIKKSISTLKQFLSLHGKKSLIKPIEEFVDKKFQKKQSLITDFFKLHNSIIVFILVK